MQDNANPILLARWFPVAAASELVRRHVFQTELLGEELALWRDDDGQVNVWENRCPHRGLRLTLGHNLGQELRCQYHGWRYASGSGRCTAIAAHPALTPPKGFRVKSYACREKYGLVWANLDGDDAAPRLPALDGVASLVLRSLPFNVSSARLLHALRGSTLARAPPSGAAALPGTALRELDAFTLQAVAAPGEPRGTLCLLLQPLSRQRTVLHGALAAPYPAGARLQLLRHYSDLLSALRRRIEAGEPVQLHGANPAAEEGMWTSAAAAPLDRRCKERVTMPQPMIRLYDFEPSGDCYKLRLFMTILSLPFERRMVDVYPGREHDTDAFRHLNPLGEVPVLVDGDLTLCDSQAILVYLASRYDRSGKWYPRDDPIALGRIAMWLAFAESITRTVGTARFNDFFLGEADVEGCRTEGQALFRALEEELWFAEQEGQDWVCSRDYPTIGDIACFPYVMLCEEAGLSRHDFPAIRRWTERVRRIPGFVPMPGIFPAAPLD